MPLFGSVLSRMGASPIKVQPAQEGNEPLDYMKDSTRASVRQNGSSRATVSNRQSCTIMSEHMAERGEDSVAKMQTGATVTRKMAKEGLQVVRGPDWKYGDEDGGAGLPGNVLFINKKGTATVHWHATNKIENYYRCKPKQYDLCEAVRASTVDTAAAPVRSSLFAGLFGGGAGAIRNSQHAFADKTQAITIFDWDDTLFPSTFVRSDLNLSLRLPLDKQRIPADLKEEVRSFLDQCNKEAQQLLRIAHAHSKVVLVTLARSPWVDNACAYFYPGMGEVIKQLGLKVVYAQEGQQVDYDKVKMMSNDKFEAFYAGMKGKAIAREVQDFYSQYEGQSWKNVISVGDSSFERLGTLKATKEYLKSRGAEVSLEKADDGVKRRVWATGGDDAEGAGQNSNNRGSEVNLNGHVHHVRTKVFKMVDEPTIEELITQIELLRAWMLKMIKFPNSFDLDLKALDNKEEIRKIEAALREAA